MTSLKVTERRSDRRVKNECREGVGAFVLSYTNPLADRPVRFKPARPWGPSAGPAPTPTVRTGVRPGVPRARGRCARGPRARRAACEAGCGNDVRVSLALGRAARALSGRPPTSPAALPEPRCQRTTSHRARPLRPPTASTPQGRPGWHGRDPGRRPWRALSSPWTRKSKAGRAPPRPASPSGFSPRRLCTCVGRPQGVCPLRCRHRQGRGRSWEAVGHSPSFASGQRPRVYAISGSYRP